MFRKEKETYDKEEDVSISACLLTGVDDRLCKKSVHTGDQYGFQ